MIDINIINDYGNKISFKTKLINRLIENLLFKHDILDAKISIILSNKILLNKLKKDYFNLNHFTDVQDLTLEKYLITKDVYQIYTNRLNHYNTPGFKFSLSEPTADNEKISVTPHCLSASILA